MHGSKCDVGSAGAAGCFVQLPGEAGGAVLVMRSSAY